MGPNDDESMARSLRRHWKENRAGGLGLSVIPQGDDYT